MDTETVAMAANTTCRFNLYVIEGSIEKYELMNIIEKQEVKIGII